MFRRGGTARVLLAAVMLACTACSWPQFRGDAAHTGYQRFESKIGVANVSTLNESWTGVTGNTVFSSPAVANGKVYVGSGDGKLYAFNAVRTPDCFLFSNDCPPLWTATTGASVDSSPAVANGKVYVASGDRLWVFDAAGAEGCSGTPKTCTPLWTAPTNSSAGWYSSPAVANGMVYVGSSDHRLYAFDAAGVANCFPTLKACGALWYATTGGAVNSSPAVANGVVYVGSDDGNLYAFDAPGRTNCSFIGFAYSCAPLWTAPTGSAVSNSPAVANGMVYIGSGETLRAFDAAGVANCFPTLKVCGSLWEAKLLGALSLFSSPAVANGVLYIGGRDSKLYAFDAAGRTNCSLVVLAYSCAPLWTARLGDETISSPAVANRVVYIGSYSGSLYASDAAGVSGCSGTPKTCTPLWSAVTTFNQPVHSSPAVADGMVYVGSNDGKLHAYGL